MSVQRNEFIFVTVLAALVLRNTWYKICRLEAHLGLLLGCWLQTEVLFRLPTGLTLFILFCFDWICNPNTTP